MPEHPQFKEIKEQLKVLIRRHSDRGFLPYGGSNRVGAEMVAILERAEAMDDPVLAFDIEIMLVKEGIKLLAHADDSAGSLGEAIRFSIQALAALCETADETNRKYFFETLLKTAKLQGMRDWADFGFRLLKAAVVLVRDEKQAQKVYEVCGSFGTMFSGSKYPDEHLITYQIVERLEGPEASDRYLMENLEVFEVRELAVNKALERKDYALAEQLCVQAMSQRKEWGDRNLKWAQFLESIYTETNDSEKLEGVVHYILLLGKTLYYPKLKLLYEAKGIWEQKREPLLQELSIKLMSQDYASLLNQAGELEKLLDLLREDKYLIQYYGKQVAKDFPKETYLLYEAFILDQAKEATERRRYRETCKLLQEYFEAGAREASLRLLDRLSEMYPRRPAMQDELDKLKKKLEKRK